MVTIYIKIREGLFRYGIEEIKVENGVEVRTNGRIIDVYNKNGDNVATFIHDNVIGAKVQRDSV